MTTSPLTTIACCGLFHYKNYVQQLADDGILKRFLFSHRLRTFSGKSWAKNLWAKEYLTYFALKSTLESFTDDVLPLLHDYWDIRAAANLEPSAITHAMLHGTSRRLLQKAKAQGSVILGEAVNTHPRNLFAVLNQEDEACGIKPKSRMPLQWQRLEREIASCDWLLVPSINVRKSYLEYGFPAERIRCIPFGVDTSGFKPPSDWEHRTKDVLRVVCVAQVTPRKGIHYLTKAWQQLGFTRDQAQLRIIGQIPANMRGLVDAAPEGIEFVGALDRQGVIRELQAASVFVLPTLEEGFAVVILEAMASGCAVVTTPMAGAEGVITDRQNGLIVPGRSPEGLANAIRELAVNPEFRIQLGRKACEIAHEKHGWDNYVEQLEAVYREIQPAAT